MVKDSSKDFIQSKWFKELFSGNIKVSEVAYKLKVTNNKRSPIYQGDVFSNSKPYLYDDIIIK